jgi:Cu+-exporting ATPase
MVVEETTPHRLEVEGKQVLFCSESCQEKYQQERETSATTKQLTDPVCGMDVAADSAHQSTYENVTYHFCSEGCRKKFESNPSQFLSQDL